MRKLSMEISKIRVKEYPNSDDAIVEYQIYPNAKTWSVWVRGSKKGCEEIVARVLLGAHDYFYIIGD